MFASGLRFSLIWAAIGMALANDCPAPISIANSHSEVNENVVTYHCDGGFSFEGKNRNFTCTKGSWGKIKFTCEKTCGAPPDIPNAKIIHSEEESVIYKCQANFSLGSNLSTNLNITLKCHENKWEIPNSQCLMESRNISFHKLQENSEGNANSTFMPVGNISTSFYENGTWDKINTTLVPENAVFCDDYNDENTCRLRMEPNDNSLCIDGFISGTDVSCISNNSETCPEPMTIPDSIKQRDSEVNVIYTCKPGYIQVGDISASFCENGTWTETNMNCVPENSETCPEPMNIPDSIKQRESEVNVIYTCKPGYIQVGNISASFCENGTWTETNMNCVPENCGPHPHVPSSRVTLDGNTANFTCEPGFLTEGNVLISVCENGSWSEINMTCVSKVVVSAAVSMEYRLRQKSKAFQYKLETSTSLICSFHGNEQICRCNNKSAVMILTSNRKIAKHNSFSLPAKSLRECETFCLQNESCLSLEFKESSNLCQLSKTASYFVESIIVMEAKGVSHGEKACVDFTWVNQVSVLHPAFNLSAVPPRALLCSITQEEIFCGCIQGKASFKMEVNKKIAMHNMLSFRTDDPLKCLHRCRDTQNCLSGEFKRHKKVCHLSKTAHYLADEYIFRDSPHTLYFEKQCTPF